MGLRACRRIIGSKFALNSQTIGEIVKSKWTCILAVIGVFNTGALSQSKPVEANLIHVDIEGLRSDRGQVICALFSSPAGFPKRSDKATALAKSEISHAHAACDFQGIPSGTYAVSVFHDENSNDKLDTDFVGIPREGVGASNNAKGHFGPPKFSAAAFQYSAGRYDLTITINYL